MYLYIIKFVFKYIEGQGQQNWPRASPDWPMDSLSVSVYWQVLVTTVYCTYYSHCSLLRKAKPARFLPFTKGKTDGGHFFRTL